MSAEVTIHDRQLTEIMSRLTELQLLSVTIGFQGEDGAKIHPGANVSVATIAMYAEFGTIYSPARAFLRSTMFERRSEIAKVWAREVAKVAEGKAKPVAALSAVGADMVEMVRHRIRTASSWATPNAPSTIKKKGHGRPLLGGDPSKNLAPGTMLDSVSWAVRRAGAVVAEGH